MNARKLFKNLGYKPTTIYNGLQEELGDFIVYLNSKTLCQIWFFKETKTYVAENHLDEPLEVGVDLFKAIDQQMKELGWNE